MFLSLILIVVFNVAIRYGLPFLIVTVAGSIAGVDLSSQNRSNMIASSNNYQFSGVHILERVFIYFDMLAITIILFFPRISGMFVLGLMLCIVVSIFEAVFSVRRGNAYTWVFKRSSLFGKRNQSNKNNKSKFVNSNPGAGNRSILPSQQYNQQQYNMNQGYRNNVQQMAMTTHVDNNRVITSSRELVSRPADTTINNQPVWSVNGSDKVFIMSGGDIVIVGNNNNLHSYQTTKLTSNNEPVSIYRLSNSFAVDQIVSIVKCKPTMYQSKSKDSKWLFISDTGMLLYTPFITNECKCLYQDENYRVVNEDVTAKEIIPVVEETILDKRGSIKEFNIYQSAMIGNVLMFKRDGSNAYQCKLTSDYKIDYGSNEVVNQSDEVNNTREEVNDIKVESIAPDIDCIEYEKEDTSEEAVSVITAMKDVFAKIPDRNSLKVKANTLLNRKLPGLGNDGVYNDGTCDVMCELGELMIKWRGDMKPHVVDAFISKLIPITTMNNVLNRIGNDWVDTTMQNLIQDMAQAVEDDVNMNLSNCLNYWINTDKDIYYVSIVYNGATGDQTSFSTQLYNMMASKFGHIGISLGEEIGYKSSCYPADTKRFENNKYYVFQEINATYDVFKDLLTEENPGIEVHKAIVQEVGMALRCTRKICYSRGSGYKKAYCYTTELEKHYIKDWAKAGYCHIIKMNNNILTASKIRDAIYDTIADDNYFDDYAPVLLVAFENTKDDDKSSMLDASFLYMRTKSKEELYKYLLNTSLLTAACHTKTGTYLLGSDVFGKIYICLFKRNNKNKEDLQ